MSRCFRHPTTWSLHARYRYILVLLSAPPGGGEFCGVISSPLSTLISLLRDEAPSGVAGAPEGGDLSSSGSILAGKRKKRGAVMVLWNQSNQVHWGNLGPGS